MHHQHQTTTHQMQHGTTACMLRCFHVIIQVWYEPQALNTLSRAAWIHHQVMWEVTINTVQSEKQNIPIF